MSVVGATVALVLVPALPSNAATLKAGQSYVFAERGATTISLVLTQNGATLAIRQSDKYFPYEFTLGNTGTRATVPIQWGLPSSAVIKFQVTVVSGTLVFKGVVLDAGALVPLAQAQALPVLTVYGDSIGDGWNSGGPINDSDGYADQLAGLLGHRLSSQSVPGMSAYCWGQYHVQDVVRSRPSIVIEAFGTNDVAGDFWGCKPTQDQFRSALDSMFSQLLARLGSVPIYVSAILPRQDIDVTSWNSIIQTEAGTYGLPYIDPSGSLVLWSDYSDGVHPNLSGHTHLATFWSGVVTTAT